MSYSHTALGTSCSTTLETNRRRNKSIMKHFIQMLIIYLIDSRFFHACREGDSDHRSWALETDCVDTNAVVILHPISRPVRAISDQPCCSTRQRLMRPRGRWRVSADWCSWHRTWAVPPVQCPRFTAPVPVSRPVSLSLKEFLFLLSPPPGLTSAPISPSLSFICVRGLDFTFLC